MIKMKNADMVGVASFIDIFQFLLRFAKDSRRDFFQKRTQLECSTPVPYELERINVV